MTATTETQRAPLKQAEEPGANTPIHRVLGSRVAFVATALMALAQRKPASPSWPTPQF
jgi:hypothetical protein